jgi:hypothetical protein
MAWHDAVKRIWLRDGGTEDGFQRAFPRLAAYGDRNR